MTHTKKQVDALVDHYRTVREGKAKGCIAKCDNGLVWYTFEDHLGNKERKSSSCTFCQEGEGT